MAEAGRGESVELLETGLEERPCSHSDFIFSDPISYPRQNILEAERQRTGTTIQESPCRLDQNYQHWTNRPKVCGQEVYYEAKDTHELDFLLPIWPGYIKQKKWKAKQAPPVKHTHHQVTSERTYPVKHEIPTGNTWTGGCLLPHFTLSYPAIQLKFFEIIPSATQ